jgi:Ca-activated chloride channel family protein
MTFEWPSPLWGLVALPLLVWTYLRVLGRRPRRVVLVPNVELLAQAAAAHGRWRRHGPSVLFLLALAAVIVGMARPVAPLIAGPLLQSTLAAPFLIAGGLKIVYDLALYALFRDRDRT